MGSDPPPPAPPQDDQTPSQYRPRLRTFVIAFLLMSLLNVILPVQLPNGTTFLSLMVMHLISNGFVLALSTLYFRAVRKLAWSAAAAYSFMLVAGMFAADILFAILRFR